MSHADATQEAAGSAAEGIAEQAPVKATNFLNPDDWKFKTDALRGATEQTQTPSELTPAHEGSIPEGVPDAETAVPPDEAAQQTAESAADVEPGVVPDGLSRLSESAGSPIEMIMLDKSTASIDKIGKITDILPDSTIRRLTEISLQDFMKGSAAKKIEVMEGVSSRTADTLVKTVKELVKHLDHVRGSKIARDLTLGGLSKSVVLFDKTK
jgi:hypothetical protein